MNSNPNEFFEKAKDFSKNKEYEKALEYFDICYRYGYVREKVLIEKLKIFFELEKWQEAERCCLEYIENPDDKYMESEVRLNLSKIYKINARMDKAVEVFDSINKDFVKDINAFYIERLDLSYSSYKDYFLVHQFSGDKNELFNEFNIIKDIPPYDSQTLFFLARVANFLHDYDYTKKLIEKYGVLAENNVFYKNAVLNEHEIATGSVILKSFPRGLWLAVSSKCNISCIMCRSNETNYELSENNMQKISTYFKYLEHISWWGGEPTISPKFYKLLGKALEYKNIKHTIITNGQHMPDELVDIIVKNNIEIVLSVDAVEKEKYESIRKGASFDKLLNTIGKLAPVREKGLVRINYVVMNMNKDELKKVFDFAGRYKISKINFIPGCGNNTEKNDFQISNSDINDISAELSDAKNMDVFNSCVIIKNDVRQINCVRNEFCHTPWTYMTFSYKGTIIPDNLCKFFNDKEFVLDETNLLEYWNSEYAQDLRKSVLQKHACNYNCPQANINKLL